MRKFTHIFFDLDHTLWDYDFNSRKVLEDVYNHFTLKTLLTVSFDGFISSFYQVNAELWHQYNQGEIDRDYIRSERFKKVVLDCGGNNTNGLATGLSAFFLHHCPRQPHKMEDADLALSYLRKRYGMSIITNGFEDVQTIKLKSSNLDQYFSSVFTSETTGHKKPSPEIFHHALSELKLTKEEVLMIGDNPNTDILGAQNAGITPMLYNPSQRIRSNCELQITHLSELLKIL